uniref:PhoD-like phosphatase metallophosphatase domain-containing protein n=1 Tax=Kwoniella dejecticola CBS 10117 TaxID=1296121 RepID=A0A1A6A1Y8_9TREE|nr:uncharacterized protein I303_04931 [Kwoniella dejecticola CBS 10117]OBR84075.1 hypothetical protein I303_04931 [Kwoniella dejecticola CBS 10117]
MEIPATTSATDYTTNVPLDDLGPDTLYQYQLGRDISGTFTTRREEAELDRFTILSSSCLKPGWPYNPFQHPLAVKGLTHLHNTVEQMAQRPEAPLFLGDFISPVSDYTISYYRELYRQVYSSPSWTPLLQSIPWIHMFDDHEIINDFSPSSTPQSTEMFENAMEPYISYQRSVNPPALTGSQPTYFSYEIGKVSFFILDNRSHRSAPAHRPGKKLNGWVWGKVNAGCAAVAGHEGLGGTAGKKRRQTPGIRVWCTCHEKLVRGKG